MIDKKFSVYWRRFELRWFWNKKDNLHDSTFEKI